MTTEDISCRHWKELYKAAMLECDSAKSPSLINDAMNSVLDQIEEAHTDAELEDLNNALNGLRSRRKQVSGSKRSDDSQKNAA